MAFGKIILTDADEPILFALSMEHRAVLEHHRQFKNYKATAIALGTPLGTVKSRLHRARVGLVVLRENYTACLATQAEALKGI